MQLQKDITIKLNNEQFMYLVNTMRLINENYDTFKLSEFKTITLMLNTIFIKTLYKFEKKLIPIQPKYNIKLPTEEALCLQLHLINFNRITCPFTKVLLSNITNHIHQQLIV